MIRKRRNCAMMVAIFLLVGTIFYIMNLYTPLSRDDFSNSYSYYTGQRLQSFRDIIPSSLAYYYNGFGRVIPCFIGQSFLLVEKNVFNFANTISFLLLGVVIQYLGTGQAPIKHPATQLFIFGMMFWMTPCFGDSYLWLAGSTCYQIGLLIILAYLIPYRFAMDHSSTRFIWPIEAIKFILMFLLGFCAGMIAEHTGIALVAISAAYLLYYKSRGIRLRPWMFGFGALAGCVTLLASPRTSVVTGQPFLSLVSQMIKGILSVTVWIWIYFYQLFFLFLVLIFWYIYQNHHQIPTKATLKAEFHRFAYILIYLLGFLGSTYCFIVTGGISGRACSGPLAFLLIAIIGFYYQAGLKLPSYASRVLCSLFSAGTLLVSAHTLYQFRDISIQYQQRETIIEKAIENGEDAAVLPAISSTNRWSLLYNNDTDLSLNASENDVLAQYYGLKKIIRDVPVSMCDG